MSGLSQSGPITIAGKLAPLTIAGKPEPKVTIASSSQRVREYCLKKQASPELDGKPLRNVDPITGGLEIFASTEELMRWVPAFGWDKLAHWCKMPIFRIRLFRSREAFRQGGLDRCYTEHFYPEGEDLLSALVWWRKRVREEGQGFAVFEGGFDTSGLVYLTDPPRCGIDAPSGEVEADDAEELERKRALHHKRAGMDMRWARKGLSQEARNKIEVAEVGIQERKRRGEAYTLRGGWVPSQKLSVVGADIGGATPRHYTPAATLLDVNKHNQYQKRFGCK